MGAGGAAEVFVTAPAPAFGEGAQKPSHIPLEGLPLAARHREHGVKAWGSGRGTPTHSVDSWAPSVPDTLPGVTAGSGAGSPGHQCGAAPRGSPFVPGRVPAVLVPWGRSLILTPPPTSRVAAHAGTWTVGTPPAPSVGLRPASCWSEQPPNRQVQTGGRSPASPAAPLGRGDAGAVP